MKKVRAFISFAAEDDRIRDLFIGQGKLPDTPWNIADWSLHEPFSEKWKTQTRPRMPSRIMCKEEPSPGGRF